MTANKWSEILIQITVWIALALIFGLVKYGVETYKSEDAKRELSESFHYFSSEIVSIKDHTFFEIIIENKNSEIIQNPHIQIQFQPQLNAINLKNTKVLNQYIKYSPKNAGDISEVTQNGVLKVALDNLKPMQRKKITFLFPHTQWITYGTSPSQHDFQIEIVGNLATKPISAQKITSEAAFIKNNTTKFDSFVFIFMFFILGILATTISFYLKKKFKENSVSLIPPISDALNRSDPANLN